MEWIVVFLIAYGLYGLDRSLDVGIVVGVGCWIAWIIWGDCRRWMARR